MFYFTFFSVWSMEFEYKIELHLVVLINNERIVNVSISTIYLCVVWHNPFPRTVMLGERPDQWLAKWPVASSYIQ